MANQLSIQESHEEPTVKAALAPSSYPECIGLDELDVTSGCDVQCVYCGVRQRGLSRPLSVETLIDQPIPPGRGVYLSPNCDPFSPVAVDSTHRVLERFLPHGVRFLIITKCEIPSRTISLVAKHSRSVLVKVSLARLNQPLNAFLEPGAAHVAARLGNIRRLAAEGVVVGGLAMPLFPGVDDTPANLDELMEAFSRAGALFVKAAYVVLRLGPSQKDRSILNGIRMHPELGRSLRQMTETIKVQIGEGNVPPLGRRKELYRYLQHLCRRLRMNFVACSVLDPPILPHRAADLHVCNSIHTFAGCCLGGRLQSSTALRGGPANSGWCLIHNNTDCAPAEPASARPGSASG